MSLGWKNTLHILTLFSYVVLLLYTGNMTAYTEHASIMTVPN